MTPTTVKPLPAIDGLALRWRDRDVTVRNAKTEQLLGVLVKSMHGPWKILGEDSYGDVKSLAKRLKKRQQ